MSIECYLSINQGVEKNAVACKTRIVTHDSWLTGLQTHTLVTLWMDKDTVRLKCLTKNTPQSTQTELETTLLDLKSNVQTIYPPPPPTLVITSM